MADEVLEIEAKLIDHISAEMNKISSNITKQFEVMQGGTEKTTTGFKKFNASILSMLPSVGAITGAFYTAKKAFDVTIGAAIKFDAQMSEVSTISKQVADNLGDFSKGILTLSKETGQSLDTLTKALYDSVSAGVQAGDALKFIETASKLAIGGATTTTSAVSGLTSIVNAFNLSATEATNVADAFFVATKFGVTTVDELSSSMGQVSSVARTAGLNFKETLGAVSALTLGGMNTKMSVTALRGALVSINSLTPEVKAKMDALGLAYRVNAETGVTLADVFVNIKKASGGTLEGMQELVPNIEGANGVMILGADNGKNFKAVMEQMGNSAGETGKAYSIMADTSKVAQEKMVASFKVLGVELGQKFKNIWDVTMSSSAGSIEALGTIVLKIADVIVLAFNTVASVLSTVGVAFKTIWNVVQNAYQGIQFAIGSVVEGLFKLVNMLPVKLIPEGWVKSMEDFNLAMTSSIIDNKDDIKDGFDSYINSQGRLFESNKKTVKSLLGMQDVIKNTSGAKASTTSSSTSEQPTSSPIPVLTEAQITANKSVQDKFKADQTAFMSDLGRIKIENLKQTFEGEQQVIRDQMNVDLQNANLFISNEQIKVDAIAEIKANGNMALIENELKHNEELTKLEEEKIAVSKKTTDSIRADIKAVNEARLSAVTSMVSNASKIAGAFKNQKKLQKTLAMAEIGINTGRAIMQTWADPLLPFFLKVPAVALAAGAGIAQAVSVAKFATGGFPQGRNANIMVNEQGQESVLNAKATSNLGFGGVNALNNGQQINKTSTNEIVFSPTINITGGNMNKDALLGVLRGAKEEFASFFEKDIVGRGYLKMA